MEPVFGGRHDAGGFQFVWFPKDFFCRFVPSMSLQKNDRKDQFYAQFSRAMSFSIKPKRKNLSKKRQSRILPIEGVIAVKVESVGETAHPKFGVHRLAQVFCGLGLVPLRAASVALAPSSPP